MTWEAARYQLAVMSAGVCVFFTVMNLLMVLLRFARRQRASSVPLIGFMFGMVALIAFPVELPWQLVAGVVVGLAVAECLNLLWPASLFDPK